MAVHAIRLLGAALFGAVVLGVTTPVAAETKMPKALSVNEVIATKMLDLGATEWRVVTVPGGAAPAGAIVLAGGIQPDQKSKVGRELDPFTVMTVIPQLMPELLRITGVTANVAVGLEKVEFTSSFEPGSKVRMRGMLLAGEKTEEGHLHYRVGVSIEVEGQVGWAIVGEVHFLAGNP